MKAFSLLVASLIYTHGALVTPYFGTTTCSVAVNADNPIPLFANASSQCTQTAFFHNPASANDPTYVIVYIQNLACVGLEWSMRYSTKSCEDTSTSLSVNSSSPILCASDGQNSFRIDCSQSGFNIMTVSYPEVNCQGSNQTYMYANNYCWQLPASVSVEGVSAAKISCSAQSKDATVELSAYSDTACQNLINNEQSSFPTATCVNKIEYDCTGTGLLIPTGELSGSNTLATSWTSVILISSLSLFYAFSSY